MKVVVELEYVLFYFLFFDEEYSLEIIFDKKFVYFWFVDVYVSLNIVNRVLKY